MLPPTLDCSIQVNLINVTIIYQARAQKCILRSQECYCAKDERGIESFTESEVLQDL